MDVDALTNPTTRTLPPPAAALTIIVILIPRVGPVSGVAVE